MKRTIRILTSLLVLVAMLSSMVISVAAVEDNPAGETVSEVAQGETMDKNEGTVETNKGVVGTNEGTIETNEGLVGTNEHFVANNAEGGVIDTNKGGVFINEGTIDTNEDTVTDNDGAVTVNNGTIQENNGVVGKLLPDVDETTVKEGTGNFGYIETNNGLVWENNGKIDKNSEPSSGADEPLTQRVYKNNGEIVTNEGWVDYNDYMIDNNDGQVGVNNAIVDINNGFVWGNSATACVDENNGYVYGNLGTVNFNRIDGNVWNEIDGDRKGDVVVNHGTVYTCEDGEVTKTEYGVQVMNTGSGSGTDLIQAVENTIVKLKELFTRDGYELVGYTKEYEDPAAFEYNDAEKADELAATDYRATRPNILTLIWKAIVKPAASSTSDSYSEPVAKTSSTSVGVGSIVRVNKQRFKIIAIDGDNYVLATCDSFTEEELQDLMAILAKLLTPEQLDQLIGDAEVLSTELAAKFFGTQGGRITLTIPKAAF